MGSCTSSSAIRHTDEEYSPPSPAPQYERLGDYDLLPKRVLGSGMNGNVTEAIHRPSGKACAVKVLPRVPNTRAEVHANQSLQHPHIAQLFEACWGEEDVTMFMELCRGGELFDRITKNGPMSEPEAARILRQVLLAVAYIHEHGFVHSDLKLENILFASDADDADIKIIDFGFSEKCNADGVLYGTVGTPGYTAPEVFRGRYTNKCDLFSVGVIAYVLLSNSAPFGQDPIKSEVLIKAGDYTFGRRFNGVSDLAKDFVAGLLATNPTKRMSALEALQHSWLESQGYGHTGKPCANDRDIDQASDASTCEPSLPPP